MEEKPRGTENMGRIESVAKLLMKTWEGITENHDLPNKKPGFSFEQRRVRGELLFY